jgi:hypothetical protein
MAKDPKVLVALCACKRINLIYKTITSMMENLLGRVECDAILTVDPVGHEQDTARKIIRLVETYMEVIMSRESLDAHFGAAMYHLWSMAANYKDEYDYVFNLEDDWELLQKVDIFEMIKILEEEPDLALLRLPQFRSDADKMKNWDKFFPWNGKYFECPDELRKGVGYCGHPSLIKMEFVANCAPLINPELNPEKQFHGDNEKLVEEVMKWRYGVFSKPNHPNYIQDLGREWMVRNNFKKAGSKAFFTTWEKEE